MNLLLKLSRSLWDEQSIKLTENIVFEIDEQAKKAAAEKKIADDKKAKDSADYKARREEKAKSDKAEADDKAKIDEEYRRSQLTAEEKQLEDLSPVKKEVLKLTATARDIETKIKSSIVEDEFEKENIYTDATIYENIPIDKLLDYDNCIIIYSKSGLNEEYDKIIELYNYIPKKKTHKFTTTKIIFKYDGKNIILVIDPNDLKKMNYKDVKLFCEKVDIEFENQSFST